MAKKPEKPTSQFPGRMHRVRKDRIVTSGDGGRLHSIIDNAVDAIITIDEQGIIETVNPAVYKLFGYPPEELVGQNVNVLMPEPYHTEHSAYIQNYLETGKAKIIGIGREVLARRKNGTTFPIDLAVSEFRQANKRMFTGIIRDISARKELEANLQEREARMRSIIETAVDGIFTINKNGIIHTVNPAALHIFGYTAEELIGRNVNVLMPGAYHSEHNGYIQNYLRTGEARIIGIGREVVARRKDGSIFPIELAVSEFQHAANERMFTGIVRDISSRKRSETRLLVDHEVTRILADSASMNAATSPLLTAICSNLEFVLGEFFVLDEGKGELRCMECFISDRHSEQYVAYSLGRVFSSGMGLPGKVCASKKPLWIPEVLESEDFERKNDARKLGLHTALGIPILFKGDPLGVIMLFSAERREPDGELLNMLASVGSQIGQFIERKKVENKLKTFEAKLRQDEKLMMLGMLASEISHEIGTPLNIISGRVELIDEREKNNEQLRKELAIINQQIERINKIVRQHLNLLRKSEIEQRVELDALLRSLAALFQPYAEKLNIELEFSSNSNPVILGNEDQLQQVFINLMMNAVQEMQGGGKLSIVSDLVNAAEGKFVEVRIKDTGNGISPDLLDQIFEPFFSTKSNSGGTGLGLAIVRDIVKRHHGQVQVETEQKKGTTFYVRIPTETN